MKAFNLVDGELTGRQDRPGFSWRAAPVGTRIGAEKLGGSLFELGPGQRTFPYHYEFGNEEWLIVVAGRPTLRDPEGEHRLRPGDVVCFREGPAGAHQVRNDTDRPVRVLMLSTKRSPDLAVHVDSEKIGVWTGSDDDRGRFFRLSSAVDYWDGER